MSESRQTEQRPPADEANSFDANTVEDAAALGWLIEAEMFDADY